MQILTPEALKYVKDQGHDVTIAIMTALILTGIGAMLKGLHTVWRTLESVNSAVVGFRPAFDAHTIEDKKNFIAVNDGVTKINARQDSQEMTTARLGTKIDGLSTRVDHITEKMSERDPFFETMTQQLRSIQERLMPPVSGD